MDPSEILNVRFHLGGEFLRIGPTLDYVGGEEAMSEIEREKLSLQEVLGFLKDHMAVKESVKLYFHIPGEDLATGLLFLNDDSKCVQMADYICVGSVVDVFVEYHGEEDSVDSSSGSDFEDEITNLSDDEPDVVITCAKPAESENDLLIPDGNGVITQVMRSPLKQRRTPIVTDLDASQVVDPTQQATAPVHNSDAVPAAVGSVAQSDSDSDSGTEYIAFTDDSGEDSEVVELRRHARKFKKRLKDSKSWIGIDANGPVPIGLIANLEEQIAGEEMDWN